MAPPQWLQQRLKHSCMSQSECTLAFSPLSTDRTITSCSLQRVWCGMVGWWDASLTAAQRSEQHKQTGRQAGQARSCRVVSRPRLNALAPATNHLPESSRNQPWSPAKSNGAKSVDMREIQCRLSDLVVAWAGALLLSIIITVISIR